MILNEVNELDLLTTKEAADVLNIHWQTVTMWRTKGWITPQYAKGNACLYSRDYLIKVKNKGVGCNE